MRKEAGYTLVELLIAISVSGLIFLAVGTVLFQLSTASGYANDKLTTIHELQNAAYWFNLDGQTSISATGGPSLAFYSPSGQTITYSVAGTDLQRVEGSSTVVLAQHISSFTSSVQGRLVSMNISSAISGRMDAVEQNNYQVYLRPVSP